MNVAKDWQDYEILDMANGEKLERWKNVNAKYHRSSTGGGNWEYNKKLPDAWQVKYKNLTFNIKPMGFKHTGLFPEQAVNWDWMIEKIQKANREIKVLNLFAYTGGATVACSYAGAQVCHVDSSKGMVTWAKENIQASGLQDRPVRYIVDDVIKFVNREIRRGNKYDAIIMDPPSYGRGSNNEVWSIEKDLDGLLQSCKEILNDNFLFVCVNTYTANLSLLTLENILKVHFNNNIKVDEIALPIENSNLYLPCGITGWITND